MWLRDMGHDLPYACRAVLDALFELYRFYSRTVGVFQARPVWYSSEVAHKTVRGDNI